MYETEEEQIEAIKKWWNANGNWIIGLVLVALIGYFGWSFYQSSVRSNQEAASKVYGNLLTLSQDDSSTPEDRQGLIETLKTEYSDSTYAVYAALQAAKDDVDQDKLDQALTELNWALDHSDDRLAPVIRIRIARIQYAQGQLDDALASLEAFDITGYEVAVNELRGDILNDQGQTDAARSAYQTAYEESQQQGQGSRFLKMKLDDLGGAAPEDNA